MSMFVRKIQLVNKSLSIVLPRACAKWINAEKGTYVVLQRASGAKENQVVIRKLITERNAEDEHEE